MNNSKMSRSIFIFSVVIFFTGLTAAVQTDQTIFLAEAQDNRDTLLAQQNRTADAIAKLSEEILQLKNQYVEAIEKMFNELGQLNMQTQKECLDLKAETFKPAENEVENLENQCAKEIAKVLDELSYLKAAIPKLIENAPRLHKCEPLRFHPRCDFNVKVVNEGRTAIKLNEENDYTTVLTSRPMRSNELLEVRLERLLSKYNASIHIGVTVQSAEILDFTAFMWNIANGNWYMYWDYVAHNGRDIKHPYGQNLNDLKVGDRIGVMRKDNGSLHFFINGIDQGVAAEGVPDGVHGFIELYANAAQASIVDNTECGSF